MNEVFSDEEVRLIGQSRWRKTHSNRYNSFLIGSMFLFGAGVFIAGTYFRTFLASMIITATIAAGMAFFHIYFINDPAKKYADEFLKRVRGGIITGLEGEKHETI